jgi:WD40 repeat protein
LQGHTKRIYEVAISPDSTFIVTISHDNTARIWNIDGTQRAVLQGHILSVAISPDSTFIATGHWDSTARIWDIAGKELVTLKGHTGLVRSVAISHDGTFIVTGSNDNTARIWNINGTLRTILQQQDPKSPIISVAISSDGTFIVIMKIDISMHITAYVWSIGNPASVDSLTVNQINLISKIYKETQKNEVLELGQSSTALFRTLPQSIQAVLKEFVRLHQR